MRTLLLLACWSLASPLGHAQVADVRIKAAFLVNFAKFAEWPAEAFAGADTPLAICVVGKDPFGDNLKPGPIGKREVRVLRAVQESAFKECHVAYFAESEDRRLPQLLRAVRKLPVLTVSDIEGFAEAGGMLGLVQNDDRLQFEVNRDAATEAGLRLSSQLLKLARAVRETRR